MNTYTLGGWITSYCKVQIEAATLQEAVEKFEEHVFRAGTLIYNDVTDDPVYFDEESVAIYNTTDHPEEVATYMGYTVEELEKNYPVW